MIQQSDAGQGWQQFCGSIAAPAQQETASVKAVVTALQLLLFSKRWPGEAVVADCNSCCHAARDSTSSN